MVSIAIFNNKGGVGKTTYLYHLSNLLADAGKKVLMVVCDSQCNLTAYALTDEQISQSWSSSGNSIYQAIKPIATGTGDYIDCTPTFVSSNLYLVPGDIDLSVFEDRLGDTWSSAATQEISLRTQVAIYRYVNFEAKKLSADFVLFDLGANLGALNRSVLGGCDYFITPLSPDLFSIKGTQNLGNKFVTWNEEWNPILSRWRTKGFKELPTAKPKFLGYVMQQHNLRTNSTGMTQGWKIFGDQVNTAVMENIVDRLAPLHQVVSRDNYCLGAIPNLHSLIPYSLNARKPVYKCTGADGLKGAHISKAKSSAQDYSQMVDFLLSLV